MLSVGIDPGLAKIGIAAVRLAQRGERYGFEVCAARFLQTEATPKKKRSQDLRAAVDDVRRAGEIRAFYHEFLRDLGETPDVFAVEGYAPYKGKGGGNSWKAVIGYAQALELAFWTGKTPMVFRPQDLKLRIARSRSASKEDVQARLESRVSGLADLLSRLKKEAREHVADACGHAVLGVEEAESIGRLIGASAP